MRSEVCEEQQKEPPQRRADTEKTEEIEEWKEGRKGLSSFPFLLSASPRLCGGSSQALNIPLPLYSGYQHRTPHFRVNRGSLRQSNKNAKSEL